MTGDGAPLYLQAWSCALWLAGGEGWFAFAAPMLLSSEAHNEPRPVVRRMSCLHAGRLSMG